MFFDIDNHYQREVDRVLGFGFKPNKRSPVAAD